jgi:hypothetical protein
MLTLEQIEEGRAIATAPWSYNSWQDGADFFREHGKALIDAAERDARRGGDLQQRIFGPPLEEEPTPEQQALIDAAQRRADAERAVARDRFTELQPSLSVEFQGRPLMKDDDLSANPRAFAPKHVKAWLRANGLEAGVWNNRGRLIVDPFRVLPRLGDPPPPLTLDPATRMVW